MLQVSVLLPTSFRVRRGASSDDLGVWLAVTRRISDWPKEVEGYVELS